MKNGKYCIAIMSVGSGVGQSVITSCNLSKLPITTIGLGMNPFAFGAYECDEMDYVPVIYSQDYITGLISKCKEYNVDLIIPGSDDEALILSENIDKLTKEGLKVIVSGKVLMQLIRDKAKMCEKLTQIADIFVKSYSFSEIKEAIEQGTMKFPLIAKPRGGFASKGIEILLSEDDLIRVNDEHIIQELAIPRHGDPFREVYLQQIEKRINPQLSEISIQLVADKHGKIMGRMMSYNKLNNGVPIEILPYEDESIWSEVEKLLPILRELGYRGPLNIQGRLTDNGLKVFEMNARFTGITGLRALMGFNEVESCIKDWLDIEAPIESLKLNYDRFGTRQTTDKVISLENNSEIRHLSERINNQLIKCRKTILITGAGGYLGQALIKRLSSENYNIMAFSRAKEKIITLYEDYEKVNCCDKSDLCKGILQLGHIDYLIHCGFARPHCTNEEIADSLNFTNMLFGSAALNQVPAIINISSQSVYGTKQQQKWTENTPVMPETAYAQAKYAAELMLKNTGFINKHTYGTSIRLAALSGGQNGLVPVEVLARFVNKALNHEPIEILGGYQQMERLDVRDAADAIAALLKIDYKDWKMVYNLGTNKTYSIIEMARTVANVAESRYGLKVGLVVNPDIIKPSFVMDSSDFFDLTKWKPKYEIEDVVISLFEHLYRLKNDFEHNTSI